MARLLILCLLLIAVFAVACDRVPATGKPASGGTAESTDHPLTSDWPLSEEDGKSLQAREATRLGIPLNCSLDLGESVHIDLVFVPPGVFPMGSPAASRNPPRVVAISRGFLIAKHEITWQQFLRLEIVSELDRMTQEHVSTLHRFPDGRNFPASVSWPDAKKFCDRLAATLGVTARLVTDAE